MRGRSRLLVRMSASISTQSAAPDASTDEALVSAYGRGEEPAAAELVRRHVAALGQFLYSSGANRDEVEDLVQETLFRAFRRLASWQGRGSFRSWILSIGSNLLRDQFRRRKGRVILSIDQREIPDRADPHADLAARDTEERLRQGIAALPRLQREVFLLRAQQGTEYAEIAATLGTTPGAARVHYHNAVKRLKELVR
jgi:RNA polymerase sigma-70 factor, ECF subfamily